MSDESHQKPPPLDYFSATGTSGAGRAGLDAWMTVLALSWVPYLCGIVNASTMLASYSPRIIAQHASGAIIFMGIGAVLSLASLLGLIAKRHLWGAIAAALVLLVQLTIAICLGISAIE